MDPEQLPDVGVTVQVAVCAVFVGLVSVPLMFAALTPAAPPVRPPVTAGTAQLQIVPAGTIPFVTLTGVTVNPTPLHTVVVISVIAGVGFTVTGVVAVTTPHPPAAGIVQVTVQVPAVLVPGVIAPVAGLILKPAWAALYVPTDVPVKVTF